MTSFLLYIDPGSGSYLVQAVIAAVLGAWFWLKTYWSGVKSYFSRKRSGEAKEKQAPDTNAE